MTNQSLAGKCSIRTILSVVIVFIILVSSFATTAVAESFREYDVRVIDGANTLTVTTTETEPIEILNNAGIVLGSNDKMDITSFVEGNGGTIKISRQNTINVVFDNTISTYDIYANTVGEALEEIGAVVKKGTKINYDLSSPVSNGMVIELKSPDYVYLKIDGKKTKYAIVDGTVESLLEFAGIVLGPDDYTKPALNTKLKDKDTVSVYRVEYKTVTEKEKINFSTKEIKDSSMYDGKKKTIVKGVKGEADVTYKVKYVNGKVDTKEKLSSVTTKEPVNAKIKIGTKKLPGSDKVSPNGVKSRNGYSVGQVIKGRYSHYCACSTCNGNSRGVTSSGKRIRNGMSNPYYVACNWLPLGSVINVDGQNYTVVDKGGSGLSRKGRIDIFTPAGHSACYRLGVGSCKITIVRLGW